MKLNLTKDLVIFDVETTGTSVFADRIIQIAILKIFADGRPNISKCRFVNPEIKIPLNSIEIHHITDNMVKDSPTFKQIAKGILDLIGDADFLTYNGNRFDIPMLMQHFSRCGMEIDMTNRRCCDALRIFHKLERRRLADAVKFYCGKEFMNGHDALADVNATYEVLLGQLDKYKELAIYEEDNGEIVHNPIQNDIQKLHDFVNDKNELDFQGKVRLNSEGIAVLTFGKYQDKPVAENLAGDTNYYNWIMNGDFTTDTKKTISGLVNEFLDKKQKVQ